MVTIRVALCEEFDAVREFYHRLIEDMEEARYSPGWEKDVYPSNEYLMTSIERGELYVVIKNDEPKLMEVSDQTKNNRLQTQEIVAAMIVNHNYNESYETITWPTAARRDETLVVHTLGVAMAHSGQGIGGMMVEQVLTLAKEQGQKAVRLDVLKGNLPAEKLYTSHGFRYVDTIQMFYEDTGWTDYELYEYPIDM